MSTNKDYRKKDSLSLNMNKEACSFCWQPFCDGKGSQLKTSWHRMESNATRTANKWN